MRSVGLHRRRRRHGVRMRPGRRQLRGRRCRGLRRRRRLPAVAEPHAHQAQPAAVPPADQQPSSQPSTVFHQRGGPGAVQPAVRHAEEATATVARRQESRHAVLRVNHTHPTRNRRSITLRRRFRENEKRNL